MVIYPAQAGTSGGVLFKMFLYMFGATLLVMFLHDGIIKHMIQDEQDDKNQTEFDKGLNPQTRETYYGKQIIVKPNLSDENMMPVLGQGEHYPMQPVMQPVQPVQPVMQPVQPVMQPVPQPIQLTKRPPQLYNPYP